MQIQQNHKSDDRKNYKGDNYAKKTCQGTKKKKKLQKECKHTITDETLNGDTI